MRKNKILDALWPKTRQEIMAATLLRPERWWYLSDLARHLQTAPSSLQRELVSFVKAGILVRRVEGRQVYFRPDPDCPILAEMQSILTKTIGLVDVFRDALAPWEHAIEVAFVHGSIAQSAERSESDVDLLVVGDVGLSNLVEPLRSVERRLARPVNPIVYDRDDFRIKCAQGNHFLSTVLAGEKIFLLGNQHDLERLAQTEPSQGSHDQQGRTRGSARRGRARST